LMLSMRKINPTLRSFAAVGLLLLLFTISCGAKGPQPITILHTNDIHGHFVPEPATWLDHRPLVGGFVALDHYIRLERINASNTLLLDAGDLMTGNLICDMEYKGADGGALVEMMNMIGYDGMVYGNHEFDKPIANALGLAKIADFPILCANMADSQGTAFESPAYEIYDCKGLKVGVIGITYHQMVGMASPGNLGGFYTREPAKTVNDMVAQIDGSTDLIIVLSHLGHDNDVELAEQIKNVDLIIGGHSHTRIRFPELVNGVLIVQAGAYAQNLGRLDLVIAGDTVQSYDGKLISTFVEGIDPQPELQAFADSFATIIDDAYDVVIGQLATGWRSAYQKESNVGNWLTDAIRHKTDADVAFINSGGIRKNEIPAGPVTIKDIAEMLPFSNYVETFEATGEELMTILTENARAQGLGTHGILQVSGVAYTFKKKGDDVGLTKVRVGGKKIKKDKIYKIAGIDYVNANHSRYYTIEPQNLNDTGILLQDLIIEAVKNAKSINAKVEGRIGQASQ